MIYPTNSKGEICGRGRYTDRPHLLFFDLTKCLNPASLVLGCPTPQVCVEKCPDLKYSAYAASKSGLATERQIKYIMRPYCAKMSDSEWNRWTVDQLLQNQICPSWIIPSTNVLGRCLPVMMSGSAEAIKGNNTVVSADQTMDHKEVQDRCHQ